MHITRIKSIFAKKGIRGQITTGARAAKAFECIGDILEIVVKSSDVRIEEERTQTHQQRVWNKSSSNELQHAKIKTNNDARRRHWSFGSLYNTLTK